MITEAIANNHAALDVVLDKAYPFIRVTARNVVADGDTPDALLTMYLIDETGAVITSASYQNLGYSYWPGEPNPAFHPQPYMLGYPQTLNLGCRIGIDVGERADLGVNADALITALGTLDGAAVSPTYVCHGSAGFIGGAAGVSPRPGFLGGGYWFAGDPVGTPFDWVATFRFDGHCQVPGARIKGARFTMDGGGTFGRLIERGYFRLEGAETGIQTSLPMFSAIGDMTWMDTVLDGTVSKPAGAGAYAVNATSCWIGLDGGSTWTASELRVYGSNNDGFVFGHSPEQPIVTMELYESDVAPMFGTDGALISAQTFPCPDDATPVVFPLPQTSKRYRWVYISHDLSSRSMYVSALVLQP